MKEASLGRGYCLGFLVNVAYVGMLQWIKTIKKERKKNLWGTWNLENQMIITFEHKQASVLRCTYLRNLLHFGGKEVLYDTYVRLG